MNASQTLSVTDQSTDPCGRGYAKTDRSLVERKRLQSEAGTIPIKSEGRSLVCRIVPDHRPKRGSLGPDLAQCEIGRRISCPTALHSTAGRRRLQSRPYERLHLPPAPVGIMGP